MALVVGHSEMSLVLSAVAVTMADERTLPVVVEIGVRNGDIVCCMGDIKKPIVEIL